MQTILLIIHLVLAIALVVIVLMQRSEGGALGIGGGTPFMGARAAANALTRTTGIVAALFMLTSIGLTVLAGRDGGGGSILDETAPLGTGGKTAAPTVPDNPASLPPSTPNTPAAPLPSAPLAQ